MAVVNGPLTRGLTVAAPGGGAQGTPLGATASTSVATTDAGTAMGRHVGVRRVEGDARVSASFIGLGVCVVGGGGVGGVGGWVVGLGEWCVLGKKHEG